MVSTNVISTLNSRKKQLTLQTKYMLVRSQMKLVKHSLQLFRSVSVVVILGPRALYIALENWAKTNGCAKMEAKFISNVDPDDAAAVLNSIDVSRSLFIVVSKSGTTLETLTNEAFVKDALVKAGLNPSKHMLTATSETSPLAKSDDYLSILHG